MKHVNASYQSRFIAYFIDYLIVGTISDLILNNFVYPACKISSDLLQNKLEALYQSLYSGSIDFEAMNQVLILCLLIIGFTTLVTVVIAFIYFCIIPLFWEKQTIGRLVGKVKVVNLKDGGKVGFGWLVLREIVGGCLLTNLYGSNLVFPLVLTIVFSINKGRSLADMIGRTRLVSTRVYVQEGFIFTSQDNYSSSDYVDASFKEVQTPKKEENEYNSDDDYMVI